VIIYRAVPYLLIAAPPAILLFVILLCGCTDDTTARARFYSDPDSPASEQLVGELDRHAAREELRRTIEEAPR
jgi:hypothetical protein